MEIQEEAQIRGDESPAVRRSQPVKAVVVVVIQKGEEEVARSVSAVAAAEQHCNSRLDGRRILEVNCLVDRRAVVPRDGRPSLLLVLGGRCHLGGVAQASVGDRARRCVSSLG